MKWEEFSNWPPVWRGSHGSVDIFPEGGEGVLTGVEMIEANYALPLHLALTMEHRGKPSEAPLHCDDEEEVIPRLFEILKACIGWDISRISDLDVEL